MTEEKEESTELLSTDPVHERYVQIGRICQVVFGKHYRRLVCIVDFIDSTRVLVDGGEGKLSRIRRISFPLRWLQCTKYRLNVPRDVSQKDLIEAIDKSDVVSQWRQSVTGRRNECITKLGRMNDFERFKFYYIRGQFRKAVAHELQRLKAEKRKVSVKDSILRHKVKEQAHPVIKRVAGKFKKKLASKVAKKAEKRKARLRRVSKYYSS